MFNTMMDSVFIVPSNEGMKSRRMIHEMREMQVMNMGQYAHGNQPIQHMIYLYNYSKQPWKAQYWVREVMDKLYSPAADGYCSDEDNGQTSAWYVFSALGFYPVCPGSDEYVIGSPLFRKATLHLENGETVTISAPNNQPQNRYIESLAVDGNPYTRNYVAHETLTAGADLVFTMGSNANTSRGTADEDAPYSFSDVKE